mgnify:CR=1 FL=1
MILKMATFSFEDQRVIIRFLHLRGVTPIEIHRQLSETCGDGVMNVKNVRSWVRQFKEGRTSCDNEPKQPRPRTSRSAANIERVEKLVLEDRRVSVKSIASKVGISVGSVHTIMHDDLKMRKVSSRWVPRMLTEDHKAARVTMCQAMLTRDDGMNGTFFSSIVTMDETWMPFFNPETKRQSKQWKHTNSPPPKKFRVSASAEKMMVAMFWDSDGVILTHCVPEGTTVTGASYENVLKNKLLPALREKRPEKAARVLFHQDNAPAHRANITQAFLRENNFEVVAHAPYSPDLAPSDFWLFPTMKDTLRGRNFSSRAAIASAIFQWSKQTPREAFSAAMASWRRRCEKCVRVQGDYVEK